MVEPQILKSLENLVDGDGVFLLDTCVIVSSYFDNEKRMDILEKTEKAEGDIKFFGILKELIKKNKEIYFTPSVVCELNKRAYDHQKSIGKKKSKGVMCGNMRGDNLLNFYRTTKKRNTELKRVTQMFEDRIIKLSDEETVFYKSINLLFEGLKLRWKLSDADWEFLCYGAVLSNNKETSLISNDNGILSAWHSFMRSPYCDREKFNFYGRREQNGFIQVKHDLDYGRHVALV